MSCRCRHWWIQHSIFRLYLFIYTCAARRLAAVGSTQAPKLSSKSLLLVHGYYCSTWGRNRGKARLFFFSPFLPCCLQKWIWEIPWAVGSLKKYPALVAWWSWGCFQRCLGIWNGSTEELLFLLIFLLISLWTLFPFRMELSCVHHLIPMQQSPSLSKIKKIISQVTLGFCEKYILLS